MWHLMAGWAGWAGRLVSGQLFWASWLEKKCEPTFYDRVTMVGTYLHWHTPHYPPTHRPDAQLKGIVAPVYFSGFGIDGLDHGLIPVATAPLATAGAANAAHASVFP